MSKVHVIKDYRDNAGLRASFNELAKTTFGLDFEDWYQNGYWTDRYNPHSIIMDGKIVANVSVNRTDFEWNGQLKHFLQLGTVMTDEAYRSRGLIRRIMEEIDAEYMGKVDGIYLFANNSVLDFYPKFGFVPLRQYEYAREAKLEVNDPVVPAKKVSMAEKKEWDRLETLIRKSYSQSVFEMRDNTQLNMFYVTKFMQDCVYYCEDCDAYVIAEAEDEGLIIDMVISEKEQDLNHIVKCFGAGYKTVLLGFTPKNTDGFVVREMNPDDRQMFAKGDGFAGFEEAKVMVPLLAYA